MKKGYSPVCLLFFFSLSIFSMVLFSCSRGAKGMLETLVEIEKNGYSERDPSKETIEDLKQGIRLYQAVVDEKIKAAEQLSVYYKMLAVKYIDREMFELALESLQSAIDITPENAELFYLAGVCLARSAKSEMAEEKRENMFVQAEKYYLRALELYPGHIEALYGIAVLYIFEMDRPLDAEEYLMRLLDISKKDIDAMFLLARVYVYQGEFDKAVELYDQIIRNASDPEQKASAKRNKEELLE